MLAVVGVVAAGALAVSIGLAQRGTPRASPMQGARPLPPVAAPKNRVDRGEAVPAPTVLVTQSGIASEAAATAPESVRSRSKPASLARAPIRKSAQRVALATSAAEPGSRTGRACNGMGGLDLARCMRPQILDADRQLRDAYHDAVRQGVDQRVLVAYQRQWSTLRRRAISDPRGVVANYRQMAEELDAHTDRRLDDF